MIFRMHTRMRDDVKTKRRPELKLLLVMLSEWDQCARTLRTRRQLLCRFEFESSNGMAGVGTTECRVMVGR